MLAAAIALLAGIHADAAEPCTPPPGVDAGEVIFDGITARRVESHETGQGRWAVWEHDPRRAESASARARTEWRELQDGVAYAAIRATENPDFGDGLFHVVRIDPTRASLWAYASSHKRVEPRTAAEWAEQENLAVVINAGMYEEDHRSHTGYFRLETHTNSDRWLTSYKSALIIPRWSPARLIDLDSEDEPEFTDDDVVIQNLRLIRSPGRNVWAENGRKWSEAAVAMTRGSEILFVFSRTPFSMRDFNAKLLSLGLDVVRAMHAEGGPEASLSIHADGIDLDLSGSYETGFVENDGNQRQWPLPNVLGVRGAEPNR